MLPDDLKKCEILEQFKNSIKGLFLWRQASRPTQAKTECMKLTCTEYKLPAENVKYALKRVLLDGGLTLFGVS